MIRLENVLKISFQDVLKTSSKRLQNVLKISWRRFEDVLRISWRRLQNVLKTYGQDEYIGLDQDVLKTSSEDVRLRRTYSSWSRHLEDVFWRRKTSSRRIFAGISKMEYFAKIVNGWMFGRVLNAPLRFIETCLKLGKNIRKVTFDESISTNSVYEHLMLIKLSCGFEWLV